MLADGYDYQIGFDHFKLDWKKKGEEKVADKYMQDGAWIPKKGSVKIDGKKVKGFIYVYNDEDEIYDEETGNPIGFVSEEDAKDWHNHVSAVAKKLLYRYTNGKALYEEGLLTLHEYCALSESNKKGKNWWIMLNGHMIPKSKNTSDMVKVLSKDLQKEIEEKAPAEKRGPQPHRHTVVGEKNIKLVEVDEYGNLLEDLTSDTDEEEEDTDEEEEDSESKSEKEEESEDKEDTPIVAAKTGKKVAAKTGKKVAAKTGKSKKPADTDGTATRRWRRPLPPPRMRSPSTRSSSSSWTRRRPSLLRSTSRSPARKMTPRAPSSLSARSSSTRTSTWTSSSRLLLAPRFPTLSASPRWRHCARRSSRSSATARSSRSRRPLRRPPARSARPMPMLMPMLLALPSRPASRLAVELAPALPVL